MKSMTRKLLLWFLSSMQYVHVISDYKVGAGCHYHCFKENILNETSKPPLNIFSYILKYMIHTWLKFTLYMENSINLNLSKFLFHKLKLTYSFDGLYKGTIAFHFHTNAKNWTHRLKSSIPGALSEKHQLYGVINGHYWTFLGFAFIK